jgi:hypothetical protein
MTERSRAASVAAFVLLGWLAGLSVSPASAADEPDLIFKRSTVFKWLTPDDSAFADRAMYQFAPNPGLIK